MVSLNVVFAAVLALSVLVCVKADGPFYLPTLPYATSELAPYISETTLETHWGKHHRTYVSKLNDLVRGKPEATLSLESLIVSQSEGTPIYNNAAQAWNHAFYWKSLTPKSVEPTDSLLVNAISKSFNTVEQFQSAFTDAAISHFGSGWAWLVYDPFNGGLKVMTTHDAGSPLRFGFTPLLVCDVWEHAYYLDYKNVRADYVQSFWKLVNWDFAAENLRKALGA